MSEHREPKHTDGVLEQAQLLDPPGGKVLRVHFDGPFEGRVVTWLATLHALGPLREEDDRTVARGNFIDVGHDTPAGIPVEIGLAVERIDLPTVRNAIIMIRQYRRLHRGRHAW